MPIIGIIIAVVLLGGGATIVASDSASPGDFLFPVDRAVEEIRLAMASDETELRLKFAEERVEDLEEIIAEEETNDTDGDEDVDVSDDAVDDIDEGLDLTLDLIGGLPEGLELGGILERLLRIVSSLPTDRHSELDI